MLAPGGMLSLWMGLAIACLSDVHPAGAQFGRAPGRSASFLIAPREVTQTLREAERAIAEGQFSDAVIRLGAFFEREPGRAWDDGGLGQDFFLEDPEESADRPAVLRGSVLGYVRRMIGELPRQGWETYQLRYGPAADRELARSVDARDLEGLREVRRRYFHTSAGYQASLLLAQEAWYGGRALEASLLLDEVVATPRAIRALGDAVLLLHAAACRAADRPVPAISRRDGPVVVAGKSMPWPAEDELASWLDRYFPAGGRLSRRGGGELRLAGGHPDRNGNDAGEMPLSLESWAQRATASPNQDRQVRERNEEWAARGGVAPPSWSPIHAGGFVLMRSTERLLGVDATTGKLVWEYPWGSPSPTRAENEFSFDDYSDGGNRDDLLTQRIWNDLPYGQVTSDGERVYMLDRLGQVESVTFGAFGQRGTRPADGSRNALVALELATEGKLAWALGQGTDAFSSLDGAFFLGPPLPLDDRLYVLVEVAGDISLSCLDPETGTELWRQPLVAVDSGGIDTDPIRRVAGAVPSYHEGILFCPTGAGAMLAVDLADRTLRWGARYSRSTEFEQRARGRSGAVDVTQLMQRWSHGMAIASGTDVLLTPIESDRLWAFDAVTGDPKFGPVNRLHFRYLAGIRGERFFLVGSDRVQAFDRQTGDLVWSTPETLVAAGQRICGRGMFGPDSYFLPTTSDEVIQISLEDGSVQGRRSMNFSLGNLIAVDGRILSQSPTELAVVAGEATLEPWIEQRLADDPNDLAALVRRAELLIQRGQRREALEILEETRERDPDNDEVRRLAMLAMLGILRSDPAADGSLFDTLDELIDELEPRAELVSLKVRGAIAREDYVEAMENLLELSSIVSEPASFAEPFDVLGEDHQRQCSLDSWIAARAAEIAAAADPQQLAAVNGRLAEALEPYRDGASRFVSRSLQHFGALDGVATLRKSMFERLRAAGSTLAMERLALGANSAGQLERLSSDRLLMLGEAHIAGGFDLDLEPVMAELQARGDEPAIDRLRERAADLDGSRADEGGGWLGAIPRDDWPRRVDVTWESIRTLRGNVNVSAGLRYLPTQRLAGEQLRGWQLLRQNNSVLAIRDPNGFVRPISIEEDGRRSGDVPRAIISGGVMLVVLNDQIVALDLYRLLENDTPMLWSRGTSGDGGSLAKRRIVTNAFDDQILIDVINTSVPSPLTAEFRVGPVVGDRLLINQGGDLICLDLMTSQQLWRNASAPVGGMIVCDGNRIAIVSAETKEVVRYDALDGSPLGTEPWTWGEPWAAAGRHVLCATEVAEASGDRPRRYGLRVIDPFANEIKLEHETPGSNRRSERLPAAYGQVVDGRYLGLMDTAGRAKVWDVARGRELASLDGLPAYDDLNGLQMLATDQEFLLMPRRREGNRPTGGTATLQTVNLHNHQQINAVIAVDRESGQPRWTREFEPHWGCTVSQPSASPALFLTRGWSDFSSTGSRKREVEVLVLDLRDGGTLVEQRREFPSGANVIETVITAYPAQKRLECQIGTEQLILDFTDTAPDSETAAD